MPPDDERAGPAAGTGSSKNDLLGGEVNTYSNAQLRPIDLGLPAPPILSALGAAIIAAGRGTVVVARPDVKPARESFVPSVTGMLEVNMTGATDCNEVARRFATVADAPDGCHVIVRLSPRRWMPPSFEYALASWEWLPDIKFVVVGTDVRQVREAVTGLRAAIANHHHSINLGATG